MNTSKVIGIILFLGVKSHSMGSGFHHGFGKESRAITLQNGKLHSYICCLESCFAK